MAKPRSCGPTGCGCPARQGDPVVPGLASRAFAFGQRFRIYSLATLATVIVFGAVSAPYGARLGAGQPTPGFGVVERITIYASLLWISMLAVALLRLGLPPRTASTLGQGAALFTRAFPSSRQVMR